MSEPKDKNPRFWEEEQNRLLDELRKGQGMIYAWAQPLDGKKFSSWVSEDYPMIEKFPATKGMFVARGNPLEDTLSPKDVDEIIEKAKESGELDEKIPRTDEFYEIPRTDGIHESDRYKIKVVKGSTTPEGETIHNTDLLRIPPTINQEQKMKDDGYRKLSVPECFLIMSSLINEAMGGDPVVYERMQLYRQCIENPKSLEAWIESWGGKVVFIKPEGSKDQ